MQLSDAELVAFRLRCIQAAQRGYLVAHAEMYIEALQSDAGKVEPPVGTETGSAAHLAEMATAAIDGRTYGRKRAVKKPEPAPKPVEKPVVKSVPAPPPPVQAPPPPPVPVVEPVKAAEPVKTDDPIITVSYNSWGIEELKAEAEKREIANVDVMGKEELVAVLEASDAEEVK